VKTMQLYAFWRPAPMPFALRPHHTIGEAVFAAAL